MTTHTLIKGLSACAVLLAAGWILGFTGAGILGALGLFGVIPGLALISWSRRSLRPAHLLAAAIISLPLSTLLFALTRLAGIGVTGGVAVLVAVVVIPSVAASRHRTRLLIRRNEGFILGISAMAGLLLGLALQPPGIRASWHGFFHAAVVEQILNEGLPPTNPGMVGESLNFYWAYHIFVALVSATSNANPLTVIAAMNAVFLALSLIIAFQAARFCLPRFRDRLLAMIALVGAINTGAGLVLLAKFLRHGRVPGDAYSDGTWIDWLSQRAITGRLWDGRASSFIKEYYDISGMAAGMTLFFAYAWLWLGGMRRWGRWFVPLVAATVLTLFTWYPPLALPALVHCASTAALFGWRERHAWKRHSPALCRAAVVLLISLLVVVPYFDQITDSRGWIQASDPFLTLDADLRSIAGALTPFWFLVPFIALGVATGLRRRQRTYVHLMLFSFILFGFAACTDVQQNTQYKYVYVLSLPSALLAMQGMRLVVDRIAFFGQQPQVTTALLALLLIHPALIFAVGAATSAQHSDQSLAIAGRHIVDHTDPARMDCLTWIRDHTPRDAVIIIPLIPHDRSPSNPGFRDVAMAQRAAFLVYDVFHSKRFRGYESRAAVVQQLFERDDFEAASKALRDMIIDRPLFVLKKHGASSAVPVGWHIDHANQEWLVLRWNSSTPAEQ